MGNRCIDPQSSRSSQSSQRVPGRLRVFFATACFVSFAPFVSFVSAQPPDRAGTEAMARRATERLQALQREADHLASEERTLLNEVRKLEIERQIRTEELKQLDADAAKIRLELASTAQRLDALINEENAQRPELRGRLVEIYKLGEARYARLLLSAPDLRQIGRASRTVAALAKLDRERVLAHQNTMAELKIARAALE